MSAKGLLPKLITCSAVLLIVLFAINDSVVKAGPVLQTWPSRTPTAGPEQTRPSGGSTPGSGGQATSTQETTPTVESIPVGGTPTAVLSPATSVIVPTRTLLPSTTDQPSAFVTIAADKIGACDVPPYIQVLGSASVRQGVGTDFGIIGLLDHSDVRVILGRAEMAPWWLIQFDSDQAGWVSDQAVAVLGNTSLVPIVERDYSATVPGTLWSPTPNPRCTPPAPIAEEDAGANLDTGANSGDAEVVDSTNVEQPLSVTQVSDSADGTSNGQQTPNPSDQSDRPQSNSSDFTWLLVTGIFLIVVGMVSVFIRRRSK